MTPATPAITSRNNQRHRSAHHAIAPADRCVVKRDGTIVAWDPAKITRAVALAFFEEARGTAANPDRDNAAGCYGLEAATFAKVRQVTTRVAHMLELFYRAGRHPTIEQVQ